MSVQTLERVSLVRESEKERLTLDPDVLAGLVDSWKTRGNSTTFWFGYVRDAFMAFVVQRAEDVDEIGWCADCNQPLLTSDDEVVPGEDGPYCESCADSACRCEDCGIIPSDYYSINDGDYVVCYGCYGRGNYSYCDECDINYHDDDAAEHTHDGSDCCDPVRTEFSIRNDGEEPLRNDTRVEITLPAGTVDEEGISRIWNYLRTRAFDLQDTEHDRVYRETGGDYGAANRAVTAMPEVNALFQAAYLVGNLDPRWQTKEGNFPKRLSRALYKATTNHLKLPAEVMSEIGNIARQHTGDMATYRVEVTRQLNMSAEDFYHKDSCWWGSYSASRCALKSNGGFGMRTFDTYDGDVAGRAWVMPLKATEDGRLVPTFETMTPDAFIVFNGYGELSGYTATRILAYMAGWTYRKISFTCDPMFVNEHKGYLVASEDIAAKYAETGLRLYVSQHSTLHTEERTDA